MDGYSIEHKEGDEEHYVYFYGSFIGGYPSYAQAKAAIQRLRRLDRQEDECYSYAGPTKSPSVVWDTIYWAD